jgi:hypothetical protein
MLIVLYICAQMASASTPSAGKVASAPPDIVFDDTACTLSFAGRTFPAYNNAAPESKGKWPEGEFVHHLFNPHIEGFDFFRPRSCYVDTDLRVLLSDGGPDTKFGCHGNVMFDTTVHGRFYMGIHSGRRDSTDPAGRKGVQYQTLGCIRTTDEAMHALRTLVNPVIGKTRLRVIRPPKPTVLVTAEASAVTATAASASSAPSAASASDAASGSAASAASVASIPATSLGPVAGDASAKPK